MRKKKISMTYEELIRIALEEAHRAAQLGEIPVGAVVALNGKILARAHNFREATSDPSAHAEIVALREAGERLGTWRLEGTTVAVTLEPCAMCAGALVNARVRTLVYGCPDPNAGAALSLYNIVQDPRLNHELEVVSGVLARECAAILEQFFEVRRGSPETRHDD